MELANVLVDGAVIAHLKGTDKREVLDEMCTALALSVDVIDKEPLLEAVLEREKLGSTAIGHFVAVPHAKIDSLDKICVTFARSSEGVDFHGPDDELSKLFFMIVAPSSSTSEHLKVLAVISTLVKEASFREALLNAKSVDEINNIIKESEAALLGSDSNGKKAS